MIICYVNFIDFMDTMTKTKSITNRTRGGQKSEMERDGEGQRERWSNHIIMHVMKNIITHIRSNSKNSRKQQKNDRLYIYLSI